MRAFYTDIYGCHADLYQDLHQDTTRLTVRTASGSLIVRKEYRTWREAKIAMGKYGDCWWNDITGAPVG